MVTFVIVLLVIQAIALALYFLQARYEIALSNWYNRIAPMEDDLWPPQDDYDVDDYDVWACCNHCFTEDGELSHDHSLFDKHTVPCNEPFCSQG